MYVQFFGFSRPILPDAVAQDDAVFRNPAAAQLIHDLEFALSRKDSVVVLAGASGTGKTTLANDALRSVSTRLAFACLSHPPQSGDELLEQLLNDFGFEVAATSRVERLQLWRQFLSEMTATETRICLLVENAENLGLDVQQMLHQLTAADAALSPGANVILTTTGPAERLLAEPELQGFSQRIRLRRRLQPLTAREVAEYLEFKCSYADVAAADVFATDVAPALAELSGGIVRVIDNLLETSLMAAAAAGTRPVTAELLETVAEQHFGLHQLDDAEVDELLLESRDDEESASGEFDFAPEDIPTLTDLVDAPAYVQESGKH